MVRKHMRRAAKAAYAVSLAVAIVIGLTTAGAASAAPATKPTVTIGVKNFTEQYVLGQLYKQALEAKGYTVHYKQDIANSELADTALKSGKINFLPDYDGVIVTDLAKEPFPKTAAATYAAAKKWEAKSGFTILKPTPFFDSDGFVVTSATAHKYGLKTISDMKKLPSFSYAGYPECQHRITCLLGLKNVYGLKHVKFVPLASISVYTLLDEGKVTGGDGFSTDPQLLGGKYKSLIDNKHIFGFQNVVPILSKTLAADSTLVKTVNAVSAKLTIPAMIAMNKAVAIDKKSPADVAGQFLKANHLG